MQLFLRVEPTLERFLLLLNFVLDTLSSRLQFGQVCNQVLLQSFFSGSDGLTRVLHAPRHLLLQLVVRVGSALGDAASYLGHGAVKLRGKGLHGIFHFVEFAMDNRFNFFEFSAEDGRCGGGFRPKMILLLVDHVELGLKL